MRTVARIPYADPNAPAVAEHAERIRRERGGKVLNLYRMLLHSPPVALGWLGFLTAIRQQAELAGRYRELAILRIAVLNGASYEFKQHVPFALAEGLTRAQLDALQAGAAPADLADADRAVLAYTDAMTREIRVPDDVFAAVRKHFSERELVELTATVGAYNLVSRFLEAIQIDHE